MKAGALLQLLLLAVATPQGPDSLCPGALTSRPASLVCHGEVPVAPHAPAPTLAQFCPYGAASYCVTPYGGCFLGQPLCRGAPCFCPTVYGPIWGYAE